MALLENARDLKLDRVTKDIVLENGDLVLSSGVKSISQALEARLRFFLGEWFLDGSEGLPYFQRILKKNPNLSQVRELIRRTILETPGIDEVTQLGVSFENKRRALQVSFVASSELGEILEVEVVAP